MSEITKCTQGKKGNKFLFSLHNYFNFQICPALQSGFGVLPHFQFLLTYNKISLTKVAWYVFRVKNVHFRSPFHQARQSQATYITLLGEVNTLGLLVLFLSTLLLHTFGKIKKSDKK